MWTRAGLRTLPRGSSVSTASGWMAISPAKNTPLQAGAMGPAECMGSYPILGLSLYFSYSTFVCKVELEENATDHGVP